MQRTVNQYFKKNLQKLDNLKAHDVLDSFKAHDVLDSFIAHDIFDNLKAQITIFRKNEIFK